LKATDPETVEQSKELEAEMRPATTGANPGIYFHIPFCQSRCNYCHFVKQPWHKETADRYTEMLIRELKMFSAARMNKYPVNSIYFGGGTPSLLPAEHIVEILSACRSLFPVSADCEISLEANPGTLSEDKLKIYRQTGVNRISLGAQSFDDGELASINRNHTSGIIEKSFRLLRENGFDNINLDMMLGLPNQTMPTWMNNLEKLVVLAPDHVSVYMLDLDDKCELASMVEQGVTQIPSEDLVSDLYLTTIEYLAAHSCAQYEISNFAVRDRACRHNLKYWRREPVYGFGLGSHSFDGSSRWANYSDLQKYFETIESGRNPVEWCEPVDDLHALAEELFLGLRLNRGVDWKQLQNLFGSARIQKYEDWLRQISEQGLLEWKDSSIRLTPLGMLLSNEIFQKFV
jgi:oxygen-independent coproporphyrinogen-3 oxidase